ncbi:hypothetical protein AB0C42_16385 [Micromonospora taraxaci]|nr:hypothetical protein [Micromonospora taraxaci]
MLIVGLDEQSWQPIGRLTREGECLVVADGVAGELVGVVDKEFRR